MHYPKLASLLKLLLTIIIRMIDNLIDYIYNKEKIYYNQDMDSATIYTGIIAACYVSKASFSFWYNAANDPSNPWYNYLGKDKKPLGRIWHAIKVAAADTWGFLTGGWHTGNFNPQDNSWPVEWHIDEAIDNASEKSSSV